MDRARARSSIRGLGGRHPRRDPVLDPRRGDGLGPGRRGQLGRHGADVGRLPEAGRGRRADPGRGLDHPGTTPDRRHRGPHRRRRDRRSSWPRRPASTSPPTRHASAISASATPTAPRKRTAPRRQPIRPDRWTPSDDDRTRGAAHRPSRRPPRARPRPMPSPSSPRTATRPRRSATSLAELTNDPDGFATRPDRRPRRPRRPGVPGRSAARRARHRRDPRRPLAAARRRPARVPQRLEGRARHAAPVHRRSPLPRARARSALVRLRPPRADPRHRDRAHLAADAPRRPRGRRLDHRRFAGPPVRQGHRRRDLPLGRARAARLQPVALGAPAHRLDDRDDDPRRPQARPRSRGRRPRPAAARGR